MKLGRSNIAVGVIFALLWVLAGAEHRAQADIRLTRPGEAQSRIDPSSYEKVPGLEHLDSQRVSDRMPANVVSPEFEFQKAELPAAPESAWAGVQQVSLIVSETGFYPNRIFLTQNVPVTIFLTTTASHTSCFMVNVLGIRQGITPGKVEEITFVPEQSGVYRFYCPIDSIQGKIVVKEAPIPSKDLDSN